jgi:hypothetical protein
MMGKGKKVLTSIYLKFSQFFADALNYLLHRKVPVNLRTQAAVSDQTK